MGLGAESRSIEVIGVVRDSVTSAFRTTRAAPSSFPICRRPILKSE